MFLNIAIFLGLKQQNKNSMLLIFFLLHILVNFSYLQALSMQCHASSARGARLFLDCAALYYFLIIYLPGSRLVELSGSLDLKHEVPAVHKLHHEKQPVGGLKNKYSKNCSGLLDPDQGPGDRKRPDPALDPQH